MDNVESSSKVGQVDWSISAWVDTAWFKVKFIRNRLITGELIRRAITLSTDLEFTSPVTSFSRLQPSQKFGPLER